MSFLLMLMLGLASNVNAQTSTGIVVKMLFPPRNYELPLGDTLTPVVRVWNTDTVADSGMKIHYLITNAITNITIYADPIVLPSIAPGDSLDTAFEPYVSSPDKISELGTFNGCLYPGDTECSLLFGIRRTSVPFFDPSDGYSKTVSNALTSKSIDIPNQTLWVSLGATVVDGEDSTWDPPPPRYLGQGTGPDGMISPVIRLDRLDYNGNFYAGTGVGDTLTSFPINLAGKGSIYFYFDYMRAGRHRYPFGWDDSVMFGPESTITDSAGNVIRAGDSLILEFEKPSGPVANPGPNDWNEIAAIDGGRDFEYKRFSATPGSVGWQITEDGVTKKLSDTSNYFTSDFRFRLRLKANNDDSQTAPPVDDADQWYIDNPIIMFPIVPEYELRWVRFANPYTKVPLSQAVFPIFVSLGIIGIGEALDLPIQVDITNPEGDTVYSQLIEIPQWFGVDTVIQFPDWDASGEPGNDTGAYTIFAQITEPNSENFQTTETYSKFYLKTEPEGSAYQEFAMDGAGMNPAPGVGNDIPKITGVPGSGMGFKSTTGSIAFGFSLAHYDSLAGVRIYFGSANPSPDRIDVVLTGESNQGAGASILTWRDTAHLDQFASYYFPEPVLLSGGASYRLSVEQVSDNNMELGGNFDRGGAQIVRTGNSIPQSSLIYTSPYGTQWGTGASDNNANAIGAFDLEIGEGSFNWIPYSSAMTSPDNFQPLLHIGDTLPWIGAGTYIPMIRPILGPVPPQSAVNAGEGIPDFVLEPCYPNPFDPSATSTSITFTLDAQSQTSLTICNVLGKVVSTVLNADLTTGSHIIAWDGRDENGAIVPAGTYFVILSSGGRHATAKIIVIP